MPSLLRRRGLQIASVHRFQFGCLLPLPTFDQFALLGASRLPPAASADSNGAQRAISIFGHQRLVAESYGLGIAEHMRFTDLVLHAYLIGDRLEPIGIIADQDSGSHTRGDGLNPLG